MTDNVVGDEQLSPEQRKEIIAQLSGAKTKEFIIRQEEIVTRSVEDVRRQAVSKRLNSSQRKLYACNTYGKDFELAGTASNYCVAIQFDAMNKANREIGSDLIAGLEKDMPGEAEELQNPLFLKTKDNLNVQNPVCTTDSARCSAARYCPETIRKYNSSGCVENAGCKNNITVSSYVDRNGMVKKDDNGQPKLKDGDLLFVRIGQAGNTASGLHCIRANVSETGQVTYTAGNNERVKGRMNYYLDKPVTVFHTSDYANKCFTHHFEKLSDKELLQLQAQLNPEREEVCQSVETPVDQAEKKQAAAPVMQNGMAVPIDRPENVEQLAASMAAGHSAISERIAAFRQRRNTESLARADIVAGMRADNARLQQRREELAGMRGEKAVHHHEFMFEVKHYQCEEVADAAKQAERQQEIPQRQTSGLRKFMNLFSRSEYA